MPVFNAAGLPVQLLPVLDRNFSDLAATLKPGQALRGRVTEVFSDGRAIVNFRGIPVTAELKGVVLEKGEVIQVAVRDLQGTPIFQLLRGTPAGAGDTAAAVGGTPGAVPVGLDPVTVSRLADLGLPTDGFHASILELMQDYAVPVSRESVVAVKEMMARLVSLLGEVVPAAQTAPPVPAPTQAWTAAVPAGQAPAAPPSGAAVPAATSTQTASSQPSVLPAAPALPGARPAPVSPDIILGPASEGEAMASPWPGVSSSATTEIASSLSEAYIAARLGLSPAARQAGATALTRDLGVPAATSAPVVQQGPAAPAIAGVVVPGASMPSATSSSQASAMSQAAVSGPTPAIPLPSPVAAQAPVQPTIRWADAVPQQPTVGAEPTLPPASQAPPEAAMPLPAITPAVRAQPSVPSKPLASAIHAASTTSAASMATPGPSVPSEAGTPAVPFSPGSAQASMVSAVATPGSPRPEAFPPALRTAVPAGLAPATESTGEAMQPAAIPLIPVVRLAQGPVLTAARSAFPVAVAEQANAQAAVPGTVVPLSGEVLASPAQVRQVLARAVETLDAVTKVLPPRNPALLDLVAASRELADSAAEAATPSSMGAPPAPAVLQLAANRASAVLDGLRSLLESSRALPPAEFPVLKGVAELAGLATGIIHEAVMVPANRPPFAPRGALSATRTGTGPVPAATPAPLEAAPPSAAPSSVAPSSVAASFAAPSSATLPSATLPSATLASVAPPSAAPPSVAPPSVAPPSVAPPSAAPPSAAQATTGTAVPQSAILETVGAGMIDVPRVVAALVAGLKVPVRAARDVVPEGARPVQADSVLPIAPEVSPQAGRVDTAPALVRAAGVAPEPAPRVPASPVPVSPPVSTEEVTMVMRGTPLALANRTSPPGAAPVPAPAVAIASRAVAIPVLPTGIPEPNQGARPVVSPLAAVQVAEEPAGTPARQVPDVPVSAATTAARSSVPLSPRLIETAVFMHGNALPARPEMARAAQEFLFGEPRLSQALGGFESAARSLDGARLGAPLRIALDSALKTVDRLRVSPEDGKLADRLKTAVEEMGLSHEAVLNRMSAGGKETDRRTSPDAIREARNSLKAAILEVQSRAAEALAATSAPGTREQLSRLAETVRDVVQVVQAQQLGGLPRTGPESVVYVQIPLVPGVEFRSGEVQVSWRKEKEKKRDPRTPADMTLKVETRALGPVAVSLRLIGQSLSLIFRVFDEEIQEFVSKELPDLVSRLTGFKFRVDRAVCEVDEAPEPEGRPVPPTSSLDLKA